jgi:hypothetical protein
LSTSQLLLQSSFVPSPLPLLNLSSQTLPLRLFLSNSSSPLPFLSFTPLPLLSATPSNSLPFLSPLHSSPSSFLSPSSRPLFLSFFLTSPYPLISSLHPLTVSLPILSSPPFSNALLASSSLCLLMSSFFLYSLSLFSLLYSFLTSDLSFPHRFPLFYFIFSLSSALAPLPFTMLSLLSSPLGMFSSIFSSYSSSLYPIHRDTFTSPVCIKRSTRWPVVFERDLNYHFLALCVYQLMDARGRGDVVPVYTVMCLS